MSERGSSPAHRREASAGAPSLSGADGIPRSSPVAVPPRSLSPTSGRRPVKRMSAEAELRLKSLVRERSQEAGALQRRHVTFRDKVPSSLGLELDEHLFVPVAPHSASGVASEGANVSACVRSMSKRLWIGWAHTVGRRPTMEDAMVIAGTFMFDDTKDLIALFDGHNGPATANFAAQHFPRLLERAIKPRRINEEPEALVEALEALNLRLESKGTTGGATALTLLLHGDTITIGNIGDSRGVLGVNGKSTRLTIDHSPVEPEEKERIEGAGGFIVSRTSKKGKVTSRVNGVLAVSRTLGDFSLGLKKFGVIAEPDVFQVDCADIVSDPNSFIVLACDGLYETMTDDEVVDIATKYIASAPGDVEGVAARLRDVSYSRGSNDNISVIVLMFAHGRAGKESRESVARARSNSRHTPASKTTHARTEGTSLPATVPLKAVRKMKASS
eukprot:TRINITY_DN12292_c0_g1_i1.p1 TRINITY_DN12292_c0_g1~~TRINITY_DN12292_c0_g1_i1.p1  ORF type:complete len:445 (-),score=42.55 TRINITY_DN12292_c0_g1_i1:63-1397(-)